MTPDQIKNRIETSMGAGTTAQVVDLTGTQDHYQAFVVSPVFEGKITIQRHRMVLDLFQAEIDSGEVHALTLRTNTPERKP